MNVELRPEGRIHAEHLSSEDLLIFLAPPLIKERRYKENGQQIVTGIVICQHRNHRASFCKADVRYEQIDE